jgi:hypothetical protein
MTRKNNGRLLSARLFRVSAVVSVPGHLDVLRLKVSKPALAEAESFMDAWRLCLPGCRFYNGSRELLACRMGCLSAHYAFLDGRRTVMYDDVVRANGRIKVGDFQ